MLNGLIIPILVEMTLNRVFDHGLQIHQVFSLSEDAVALCPSVVSCRDGISHFENKFS